MGQMELKCIFNIGKNISILAKVTQVSDVVHGLLVYLMYSGVVFCFEVSIFQIQDKNFYILESYA
jgi:hypothetical protein